MAIMAGETSLSKYSESALAEKQARELESLRERLAGFDQRLDDCMSSLASVQAQTALLPQMHGALKALVDAHATSA